MTEKLLNRTLNLNTNKQTTSSSALTKKRMKGNNEHLHCMHIDELCTIKLR